MVSGLVIQNKYGVQMDATFADEGVTLAVKPKAKKPSSKDYFNVVEARLDKFEELVAGWLTSIEEALLGPGWSKVHVEQFRLDFISLMTRMEDLEEKVSTIEKDSGSQGYSEVSDAHL